MISCVSLLVFLGFLLTTAVTQPEQKQDDVLLIQEEKLIQEEDKNLIEDKAVEENDNVVEEIDESMINGEQGLILIPCTPEAELIYLEPKTE